MSRPLQLVFKNFSVCLSIKTSGLAQQLLFTGQLGGLKCLEFLEYLEFIESLESLEH